MLRNKKLIHRLTLEQKISLVLSSKLYQSSQVSGYTFPDFLLSMEPISNQTNFKSTVFPKNYELAKSFNRSLIEEVSRVSGEENNCLSKNPIFKFNSELDGSIISKDSYLTGDFIFHYLKGLSNSYSSSCYELVKREEDNLFNKEVNELPDRIVLSKGNMDFILVNSFAEMNEIMDNYPSLKDKVFFSKTSVKEDLARLINSGVYINFYDGDFDEAFAYLKNACELGTNAYGRLQNRLITKKDFDALIDNGAALPVEMLDIACDNYISLLLKLDENHKKSVAENKYVSDLNNLPFDYKKHHNLAIKAAKETVVLLKNNSNVLPISSKKKVALIGDAAENYEFYQQMFSGRVPTIFQTPYQIIHNYLELDTTEYAHGYVKGQDTKDNLLDSLREVTKKSDVVLFYMWADDKTGTIPENQLRALDEIYTTKQIPIVAVIHATGSVDLSFENKCAAILLYGNAGQGISEAILDIITGSTNPSAKLTYDIYDSDKVIESENEGEEAKTIPGEKRYPFGYGLSYSNIVYKNLEINEGGADVTIQNISKFDGEEVIELYIQKKKSNKSLSNKSLRGYAHVHINSGETLKVHIAFDDETFKCYLPEKKCFGVEGGQYEVFVGDSYDSVKLKGTINLSKLVDKKYAYTQSEIENDAKTVHEFETPLDKARGIKIGLRIFGSILFYLWFVGLCAYFWFTLAYTPFVRDGVGSMIVVNATMYALGALAVILLIVVIIYIARSAKKRKKYIEEYRKSDVSLANVLQVMKEFDVSRKVVYEIEETEEVENVKSTLDEIAGAEIEKEEKFDSTVEGAEEETEEQETEEVDLEVEKEETEEPIVDIESAILSDEEIRAQEEEELRILEEIAEQSEGANEFESYEETVTFDNTQSLSQVCDRFMAYSENRGLILELSSVRSIFANLGSTHILFINSKLRDLLDDFITILCEFLGDKTHITTAEENWVSSFNLAWKKREDGSYEKTDFVNDVYNSCRFKNNLNVIAIKNVSMDNIDRYFKEFIDYSNYPSYEHYMKLNRTQKIRIPENLLFILTTEDNDYTEKMSYELATASSSVELIMRRNENVPEEFEKPDSLSYQYFNELIYEAKKNNYISEDNWKRIDNLEEEINQVEPFSISNKFVLSSERYSSIFMDCGGDEVDALDSILAEKIVPIVKTLKMYKQEGGIKNMVSLFEKHFGDENIPKAKRALQSSLHQEY